MKCPFCGHEEDKVVDSRAAQDGRAVRRRRECLNCKERFTTYEYIENVTLTVIKSDDRREPFDRQKLIHGIKLACNKRPVSAKKVEAIVDEIEARLQELSKSEVTSKFIGEMVMEKWICWNTFRVPVGGQTRPRRTFIGRQKAVPAS